MSKFVQCPYCDTVIEVEAVNCAIFTCGVLKSTGVQVNPHASRAEIEPLLAQNLIYGCGNQFELITNQEVPTKCSGR